MGKFKALFCKGPTIVKLVVMQKVLELRSLLEDVRAAIKSQPIVTDRLFAQAKTSLIAKIGAKGAIIAFQREWHGQKPLSEDQLF